MRTLPESGYAVPATGLSRAPTLSLTLSKGPGLKPLQSQYLASREICDQHGHEGRAGLAATEGPSPCCVPVLCPRVVSPPGAGSWLRLHISPDAGPGSSACYTPMFLPDTNDCASKKTVKR